jgi:hypothetical protein
MKTFSEQCEKDLKHIFNCERVNVTLVDRFRKDLFRYTHDDKNPDRLITKSYPIEQGLAGYVAISCHTIFTDKLSDENRYVMALDDPNANRDDQLAARQLITCPIFAKTDKDLFQSSSTSDNY